MKFEIILFFLLLISFEKSMVAMMESNYYGNTSYPYIGRVLAIPGKATNYSIVNTVKFPEVYFLFYFALIHTFQISFALFPSQEGPLYAKHIIRGIRHIEYCIDFPEITIVAGGIGKTHIKIIVASKVGKSFSSIFVFFGEKINEQ